MPQTQAQKRYGQRRTLANKMERFAQGLPLHEALTLQSLADMLRTPGKNMNEFCIVYREEH